MRRFRAGLPLLAFSAQIAACAPKTADEAAAPAPAPSLEDGPIASLDDLCADPAEVRSWKVLAEDGSPAAVTRGQCLGKETRGYHFVNQFQPIEADRPVWEFHLWLDRSGEPRQAQLRVPTMVRRFFWTNDGLRTSIFGDTEVVDGPSGVWVLPQHAPYLVELRMRLGIDLEAGHVERQYVSAETGQLVSADAELRSEGTEHLLELEGGNESYTGATLASLQLETLIGDDGKPLYTAADGGELSPGLDEVPRPRYVPPSDLEIVPVSIDGDPKLAAEIVRLPNPSDDPQAKRPKPRPGIVFLSGSGPQDRYGFVPGTSIDVGSHEVHDALARAGFAVIRFDDRGVGESELGDTATPGYDAFVDDARRVLDFAANHPDIDAKSLIVIGHSEGAMTAGILGREKFGKAKRPLAGVVLMAGTGRNLRDVIYTQLRNASEDPDAAEKTIAQAKKIHDAVMKDGELPAATEPVRMYLKEAFSQDPVANLERVRVPVLIAQGSKDFQVDPELDFEPLRDTVARKGHKLSEARVFDGLDHLFKPEPGISSVGHYGDMRRRVDPAFIAWLVEWASARVGLAADAPA